MLLAWHGSVLALLASCLVAVEAAPSPRSTCSTLSVRKEWRTLSKAKKLSYIAAVKYLQSKPLITASGFDGVRNRFDDFQATHINNTDYIHFVGYFQPYLSLNMLEQSFAWLTSPADGTDGSLPSMRKHFKPHAVTLDPSHWTQDSTEVLFPKAPVFDSTHGFGGNGPYINSTNDPSVTLHIPGKTGGGCVQDGPFKDFKVNMGPQFNLTYNPHYLTRDFSPYFASQTLNSTVVASALAGKTFKDFDVVAQGRTDVPGMTYHGGGHLSAGGDLGVIGDAYASPGDPSKREADISGPDTQFAYPFDFFGEIPYKNITLNYNMFFGNLTPGITWAPIKNVMDISAGPLCYTYL
ncbi:Di-copper centre-containing protein [Glonium stellatum]|uniref:Di-copper centre-containing protein n=1 Tax=Glonium stellatum TaxID=574774 RepID=A0A8E2FEP8_9PEZI|nr:Di-copper centre-containing protein [Glonium stellatum]